MSSKYQLVEEDYDNIDEGFHDTYDTTKEFHEQISSFTANLEPKVRILNIGGTASECIFFLDRNHTVTCIDISNVMLKRIKKREPRVEIMHGNIRDFGGRTFDGVWACRSLIHIPPDDIDQVLKNTYSLCTSGATFGSIFFTASEMVEEEKPEWQSTKQGTVYYRVLYPAEAIKNKIEKAGFKIVKMQPVTDNDNDAGVYIEAVKGGR